MPQTTVKTPDGSTITVSHPEGATEQQILTFASQQYAARPRTPMSQEAIRSGFDSGQTVQQLAQQQAQMTGVPTTQREILRQLSFGQRGRNDLRIMRDAVIGGVRGVPQAITDVAAPFANSLNFLGNALLPGQPFSTNVSQSMGDLMTSVGVPEIQTPGGQAMNDITRIAGGMFAGQAATNQVLGRFGYNTSPPVRPTPREQTLQAAQREGLVVPPASANHGSVGALLEGAAGKLKTGQLASARNQEVINRLAAQAVGVTDEALTPQALQSIRNQAVNAYSVLRSAGDIATDQTYLDKIDEAVSSFRSAASQSDTLAAANRQIIGLADDLAKPNFSADAAVDLIAVVRDNASTAYRQGSPALGRAYRSIAGALEDVIERNLSARGATDILSQFREARQLIAKTHTVEDALRGSQVAAQALARMLDKGRPLTGQLNLIARFAQEFPTAARVPQVAGSIPAYSPLDWWTGITSLAGAAATRNLTLALPALYSMSRPALRNFALSPFGQRLLTRGASASPAVVGAALGPTGMIGSRIDEEAQTYQ